MSQCAAFALVDASSVDYGVGRRRTSPSLFTDGGVDEGILFEGAVVGAIRHQ
jgi:hypothetical protein